MSRSGMALTLVLGLGLELAATAANAQDATPGQTHPPGATGVNGTQPFLFDGRMRGDGLRPGATADNRHPDAIVAPPKAGEPRSGHD